MAAENFGSKRIINTRLAHHNIAKALTKSVGVWADIIVLVLIVVVIIAMVSGPEAAVKWLSH